MTIAAPSSWTVRNRCEWFVFLLDEAARLVEGEGGFILDPDEELMIDDLTAVLIGDGLLSGREQGPHYILNNGLDIEDVRGASGFKHELRDESFQVHHAMAALTIGYRQGVLGHLMAIRIEEEPADDAVYNALCPLGIQMNMGTLRAPAVARAVYQQIAIPSQCVPPPRRDPLGAFTKENYKVLVINDAVEQIERLAKIKIAARERAIPWYHVVKSDSLSSIAKRIYGSDLLWPRIYGANRDLLTHHRKWVFPGQKLLIPPPKNNQPAAAYRAWVDWYNAEHPTTAIKN